MGTKKRLCQLSYSLDSKKTVLQPQPPISVSELLPNALKSQCTPSFQVYAFFTNPFDFKAFLYFVARSYVLASAVRCLQSQSRLAPCSWTAVAWAVPAFSLRQYLT